MVPLYKTNKSDQNAAGFEKEGHAQLVSLRLKQCPRPASRWRLRSVRSWCECGPCPVRRWRRFGCGRCGCGAWCCCGAAPGWGWGWRPPTATAPPAPARACSEFSQRSCEECLKNVSCLWCYTNNTCIDYPVRSILPPSSLCSLSNARWGVCWINFEALIIAIAVVAGLILVSVAVCCCYCCYCRRRSRSKPDEEEEWLARKKEERRLQSLQRKHERKLKHDEIRKKYGLLQDSDNPYSRFENE
ncbi:pituitary tumor-transforming gene 1 protein-interacting protein-like [Falco peregrinus]|uniref:pituitary tumor-transforming gene 1 protein-interacting protein-like n=1 Tax=Falco peregrinus TaxID=8954 RepID=UPI00247ACB38|nr:pituitary tumor-transforming gene 1 protein-interacting protein-like [Falco peregrinus]